MSKNFVTHKYLAEALGVSETTIKSYRRKFPGCIPVASEGKPIRFTENSLSVAKKIRDFFEAGMSVKEIRSRLALEFSWVTPEVGDNKIDSSAKSIPEMSLGVSNMAKSMVTMAQQQKTIVRRMQSIESQLEDLGLKGVDFEQQSLQKDGKNISLKGRLDHLDEVTQSLTGVIQTLGEKLDRFLGDRAKVAEQWREHQQNNIQQGNSERSSSVISFSASQKRDESQGKQSAVREIQEPGRQYYSLPLVVRTSDGRYISAAGRGRFSLNDLKARLVHGSGGAMQYSLQWEPHGDGWWLFLEQGAESMREKIDFLLMELPTQRSGNVLEILQLKKNGEMIHPAEICSIINSFVE